VFADVAGIGAVHAQRAREILIKRLGAREVRTDSRRRGPVTRLNNREGK